MLQCLQLIHHLVNFSRMIQHFDWWFLLNYFVWSRSRCFLDIIGGKRVRIISTIVGYLWLWFYNLFDGSDIDFGLNYFTIVITDCHRLESWIGRAIFIPNVHWFRTDCLFLSFGEQLIQLSATTGLRTVAIITVQTEMRWCNTMWNRFVLPGNRIKVKTLCPCRVLVVVAIFW